MGRRKVGEVVMTKQEILDTFKDIDFFYNNPSKYETLSRMLDELLEEQDQKINDLKAELDDVYENGCDFGL